MGFGEALKKLRTSRGMSQQNLADTLGVKRPTVTNYESGTSYPAFRQILDIVRLFDVSSDYLLGLIPEEKSVEGNVEGNVEARDKNQNEKYIPDVKKLHPSEYDIDEPAYTLIKADNKQHIRSIDKRKPSAPLVVTVDPSGEENIVMIDEKVAAGYAAHYLEPSFYKELPVFSLPGREFRNATFRCFQVKGDSMAPTFQPRDWVIASYVEPQRYTDNTVNFNTKEGYVYVVVTSDALLIKRVLNRVEQRGTFALQSDNEAYSTFEIDAVEIKELWYVKARLSFQFPNTRFALARKVSSLEADFEDVQRRLREIEALNTKKQG